MKISGSKRIAERYVEALFDVVASEKAVDAVEKDLLALGTALHESPEFRHFLSNPLLPSEVRAQAMLAILARLNVHQLTRQFIGMLIQKKRLSILADIVTLFEGRASAARGEMKAELISAAPLKDKEIKTIGDRLSKAYGRKMIVSQRQQADLLGGVIVKIGSQQLDSSLAGKLRRLGVNLKAA